MNNRTNLAYNRSVASPYPVDLPRRQTNVRIRVSQKAKAQAAQKRIHMQGIAKVMIVACFAFVVLFRGVMITDKSTVISQKQKELNALITSNEKLQVEIDRSLNLNTVETVAQNQLGMHRAEKYQTVYVDLEQTDFVEKTVKDVPPSINLFLPRK